MRFYSDYIFPTFYDKVLQHIGFDEPRRQVLAHAHGKILEIGIGTGLNLDHYPESVKEIWAIDPNPGMERELRAKLKKRNIIVHFSLAGAERLPFENASFDTVVSTLTTCTIPDLPQAFSEIQRVLKPDGKFLFLEHGLSADKNVARLQNFLNPVQNIIGCGCQLTINVEEELKKSNFKISQLRNYYVPQAPKILGYVYDGIAEPIR
ncbi:MAG: class I SAM-dependent methyltransferase [Bdellovibrionales bacterium]